MRFFRPTQLDEALELLRDTPDAQVLAGGATLVQAMNAGGAAPAALISLAGLSDLYGVRLDTDGGVRLGAMSCHRAVAEDDALRGGHRLLALAAARIGNPAIRNMGTIGGSVAVADPAFDTLPALLALEAELELASESETRRVSAADFLGAGESVLGAAEIIVAVVLPPMPAESAAHYERLTRTQGDSPIASVAVSLTRTAGGVESMRVAVGGCAPIPVYLPELDRAFAEGVNDPQHLSEAADRLAARCQPASDLRASAAYRRMVLPRLIERAVARALEQSAA